MSDLKGVMVCPAEPVRMRGENVEIFEGDEILGEGGMATVRLGIDKDLWREIAYKELRDYFADNDKARRLFIGEAQITAQLDHPNIVPIYEIGRSARAGEASGGPGSLYFTMKRIRGRTLEEVILDIGVESRNEKAYFKLLQIFLKVCNAIDYAHSHGVVHRDLKPENIMVGDFGEVYVLDWGIALMKSRRSSDSQKAGDPVTADGVKEHEIVGTICYMSPEQARGRVKDIDERSDIFNLGGCLYEILTGTPPYLAEEKTSEEQLRRVAQCEIDPPDKRLGFRLPTQLCGIAMKALAKDPADRYQTVGQMADDVENFMQTYSFFPEVSFKSGQLIVEEGELSSSAYIIVEGCAEVLIKNGDKQLRIRDLNAGDVFGEISVFTNLPRTASVRAVTEVKVIEIPAEKLKDDSGAGYWSNLFTRALAERFLEQERKLKVLEESLLRRIKEDG